MRAVRVALIVIAVLFVGGFGWVHAGLFNVAADAPHWGFTSRLMETIRERSIAVRADDIRVPDLDEPGLIAVGAEHYSEMCTGCHLAPGMSDTELRAGLYPKPPNLTQRAAPRSPEETFWIIKHGLKLTGMPAWGVTHADESIWGLVAFVKKLPDLSPEAYRDLTEQGHDPGAHSHDAPTKQSGSAVPTLPAGTLEPVAVVDRFFGALASGDTRSAGNLLDPGVLIYESGGAERSRKEYAAHHLGSDAAFLQKARHRLLSRTGDAVGDLAWVATEAALAAPGKGGKEISIVSTETMVLRRTEAGWRIVHIHWSSRSDQS